MGTVLKKSLLDVHPRELKGMMVDIPTLPAVYQELFRQMQDPQVSVPRIAELINQDQALAAKILHLVNSAFYGYKQEITTISRAVVILGFQAVRSAALATSVFEYFKDEPSSGAVDMTRFWTHSVAVAAGCKVLAAARGLKQQEEAFVVGLLHDVGKLIEKRHFAADFAELCQVATEQHLSWYDCEAQLFQVNHATIAKAVFRGWNFPSAVVEAIHLHHAPESSRQHPQLTALVHVADFMAYGMGYGAPGAHPPTACSGAALALLGLDEAFCAKHRDAIDEETRRSLEILTLVA